MFRLELRDNQTGQPCGRQLQIVQDDCDNDTNPRVVRDREIGAIAGGSVLGWRRESSLTMLPKPRCAPTTTHGAIAGLKPMPTPFFPAVKRVDLRYGSPLSHGNQLEFEIPLGIALLSHTHGL